MKAGEIKIVGDKDGRDGVGCEILEDEGRRSIGR